MSFSLDVRIWNYKDQFNFKTVTREILSKKEEFVLHIHRIKRGF